MQPIRNVYRTGLDLPQLRAGVLGEIRNGAAELSQTALRIPQGLQDETLARTRLMEAVYGSLKEQAGFDPTVAGSASFKLRW